VLQSVAECSSVLQRGAKSDLNCGADHDNSSDACQMQCAVAWCNALQCVAVFCNVLQCVAVCCSVLQCVAVCCSVLQDVAVWYSMLQRVAMRAAVHVPPLDRHKSSQSCNILSVSHITRHQ